MTIGRVLVIAGSDSSGGAGLEADQKTIAAHECYAMTATTALTAQNTLGVYGIHKIPSDFVKKQIDACISDIGVDVVKIGMLASEATIQVVADVLREHKVRITVVDPVMVSTSGSQLLPNDAVKTLIDQLLPLTTILTPNLPEAELLLKHTGGTTTTPKNVRDVVLMAKRIVALGPKYVLLKGGHLPLTKDRLISANKADHHTISNVLCTEDDTLIFDSDYIESENTHGTGCSLASAIASNLARGMEVEQAVKLANHFVEAGIRTSYKIGKGSGPINHFHSMYQLPFTTGRFIDYLLNRQDVREVWEEYVEHEFVAGLGDGTLPVGNFRFYLIQDYLFLLHFARANALAASKAMEWVNLIKSAKNVINLRQETDMHIRYCQGFGLSEEDMMKHEESAACTAYTRYVLDIGHSQDWYALEIAILPCLFGYGVIAENLYNSPTTVKEGNLYLGWIETYVAEDYQEAVRVCREHIETYATRQSRSRVEELAKIFIRAIKLETAFWDMGLSA